MYNKQYIEYGFDDEGKITYTLKRRNEMSKFKIGDKIIYRKGTFDEDFGVVCEAPDVQSVNGVVWANWTNTQRRQCCGESVCELDTNQNSLSLTLNVNVTGSLQDIVLVSKSKMEVLFKQLNEAGERRDQAEKDMKILQGKIANLFVFGKV